MPDKLDMSTAGKLRRVAQTMRNGITIQPHALLDEAADELKHLAGKVAHNEKRIRGLVGVAEQLLAVIDDGVEYGPRALSEIRLHLSILKQGEGS